MVEPILLASERLRRMTAQETLSSDLRNALQLLVGLRVRCRLYAVPAEESLMKDVLEFVDAIEARIEKALHRIEPQ